jgi:hypothetical protein
VDHPSAFKRFWITDPDPRMDKDERQAFARRRLIRAFNEVSDAMKEMDDWHDCEDDPF